MSINPKISVVMTVYNGQKYVYKAVESILNQTFTEFEFVIVDNKSTDRTIEIIKSFKDERIILIENEQNLGQTRALNIGVKSSKAGIIARMDADDISLPERLEIQYNFLEKNPDISVVGSWRIDIDKNGRKKRLYKSPVDPFEIRCFLSASGDLTSWCISHPTVAMRRKALESVGFYDEKDDVLHGIAQDYALWTQFVVQGYKFANIPKPLLEYRIVEGSETTNLIDRLLQHRMDITTEKIKKYIPSFTEKEVSNLCKMLEFWPQDTSDNGKEVFDLFNKYFEAFVGSDNKKARELFKTKLKLYYLPQLAKTNFWLSVIKHFKFIFLYPSLLFDARFYRKIAKSIIIKKQRERGTYSLKRLLFSNTKK